jgi:Bacteriocin-protection, YdeI or OmpD-Associated
LKQEKALAKWYASKLSEPMRWEIRKWIDGVTGAEARVRRAEQIAERMLATMEAEVELPPLIATALRRRPGALAGWEGMSEARRRNALMAVFGYRTLESRRKRLDKLVEECVEHCT